MKNYVEYSHNNSGGVDWMKKDDWQKLIDAGWIVDDRQRCSGRIFSAKRIGLSLEDAVTEWEKITGMDAAEEGCNCCGRPHYFLMYGEKEEPKAELVIVRQPNTWKVEKI
jgi:hypothetical protein